MIDAYFRDDARFKLNHCSSPLAAWVLPCLQITLCAQRTHLLFCSCLRLFRNNYYQLVLLQKWVGTNADGTLRFHT